MYKIDNQTSASVKPTRRPVGVNPNGYFRGGNPTTGTLATVVEDDWLNAVQEELSNFIVSAGLTLNKADDTQLTQAIEFYVQKTAYAITTSTANTYIATLNPAPVSYTNGMPVNIKFTNGNNGPATINLNGLGAKAIINQGGGPLVAGNITSGMIAQLIYDGTNFQLTNILDIAPVTIKRINDIYIASSQTYIPSLGLINADVEIVGGGGGGAGAISSTSQVGCGSGGGGGGWCKRNCSAADIGASIAVVIGAAGAGGTPGTAGSSGGATSFGSLMSALGGSGGITSNNSVSNSFGGGASGGSASGTPDIFIVGDNGAGAIGLAGSGTASGGKGGSTKWGYGGAGGIQTLSGSVAKGYGAGGGGGASVGVTSSSGGAGFSGLCWIREYLSV